jgi:hypothetical protein
MGTGPHGHYGFHKKRVELLAIDVRVCCLVVKGGGRVASAGPTLIHLQLRRGIEDEKTNILMANTQ